MPVERKWTPQDPKEAFFPIAERPAFWMNPDGKNYYIPGQKVLVDAERNRPLSVVSQNYKVITNERAYQMADVIVQGVFNGRTLGDFQCYNLMMPSTRSFCRMDFIIPNSGFSAFGKSTESYTPFVRISNSYNRMLVLRYEIGFCRWICLNGCIFGAKSYTATFVHSLQKKQRTIEEAIAEARRTIGSIDKIWEIIEKKLTTLSSIPVRFELALPVFCEVFGIPDIDRKDVSSSLAQKCAARAERFLEQAKSYYAEHGPTAYALFNALTDYASFPEGQESGSSTLVHGYQRKVGNWADELTQLAHQTGFQFESTISDEAKAAAKSLKKLITEGETVLVLR